MSNQSYENDINHSILNGDIKYGFYDQSTHTFY